jgi:hypothetical protein
MHAAQRREQALGIVEVDVRRFSQGPRPPLRTSGQVSVFVDPLRRASCRGEERVPVSAQRGASVRR